MCVNQSDSSIQLKDWKWTKSIQRMQSIAKLYVARCRRPCYEIWNVCPLDWIHSKHPDNCVGWSVLLNIFIVFSLASTWTSTHQEQFSIMRCHSCTIITIISVIIIILITWSLQMPHSPALWEAACDPGRKGWESVSCSAPRAPVCKHHFHNCWFHILIVKKNWF